MASRSKQSRKSIAVKPAVPRTASVPRSPNAAKNNAQSSPKAVAASSTGEGGGPAVASGTKEIPGNHYGGGYNGGASNAPNLLQQQIAARQQAEQRMSRALELLNASSSSPASPTSPASPLTQPELRSSQQGGGVSQNPRPAPVDRLLGQSVKPLPLSMQNVLASTKILSTTVARHRDSFTLTREEAERQAREAAALRDREREHGTPKENSRGVATAASKEAAAAEVRAQAEQLAAAMNAAGRGGAVTRQFYRSGAS